MKISDIIKSINCYYGTPEFSGMVTISPAWLDGYIGPTTAETICRLVSVVTETNYYNVGDRRVLRCEVVVGAFDANGVPWDRLIQFKVAGVLMFQVGDAAYRGKLIPGVFLYGATARVHAIAGDTPSGLPAFPATVGVNAADAAHAVREPIVDLVGEVADRLRVAFGSFHHLLECLAELLIDELE